MRHYQKANGKQKTGKQKTANRKKKTANRKKKTDKSKAHSARFRIASVFGGQVRCHPAVAGSFPLSSAEQSEKKHTANSVTAHSKVESCHSVGNFFRSCTALENQKGAYSMTSRTAHPSERLRTASALTLRPSYGSCLLSTLSALCTLCSMRQALCSVRYSLNIRVNFTITSRLRAGRPSKKSSPVRPRPSL